MFLDETVVEFSSGRGGAGAASFHREKHVPRGGPNGADGGKGGDIILVSDRSRRTLYDFKLQRVFTARNGGDAIGNKRGKDAPSIEIKVPVGTIVRDTTTGKLLADLNFDGMKLVVCKGGKGGFGNLHYTSSVRQAPTFAQKGAPGETVAATLELRLLADVGIIGLPNAGKSTLISRISAAKPRIADYPFTTIEPNLGVVSFRDMSFTVADMPGLVEGASEGRGLGHQFLKHVERTRLLVHLVEVRPVDESDPIRNYELIEGELRAYSPEIADRPRIVAISKTDQSQGEDLMSLLAAFQEKGVKAIAISSATGKGIDSLLERMATVLEEAEAAPAIPVLTPAMKAPEDLTWEVVPVREGFEVHGKRIERLVAMTDMQNEEALRYLHRRLERLGLINRLRELGAEEGDTVRIGELEFAFAEEE